MIERIRLLIETQNLTASQFADKIKVQRSGLSHILSGRNKASLDFAQKVIMTFPEVSPDWLINGEGSMFRKQQTKDGQEAATGEMQSLFSSASRENSKGLNESEANAEKPPLQAESDHTSVEKATDPEAVERVILFYNDGSFKEYFPNNH